MVEGFEGVLAVGAAGEDVRREGGATIAIAARGAAFENVLRIDV